MTIAVGSGIFPRRDRPLAVVTTATSWHEPPRMRHQVTRQLARFHNVLYVELPYGSAGARDEFEPVADGLVIFRPAGFSWLGRKLWHNVSHFHARLNTVLARKTEAAIRQCGYAEAVLVNFQFNFPQIMTAPVFRKRIYLCNDDFQAEARRAWARPIHRRAEHRVIGAADICLATSLPLVRKFEQSTSKVDLFLPGHEFVVRPSDAAIDAGRRGMPIHVCYMGFINGRLRLDWLLELVRDSRIDLTLIGPIETPGLAAELLARDNVVHFQSMFGDELQAKLAACDVLVTPYDVRQAAVRAMTAPNKLFQYLACGRPVVCSDLPHLLELPEKFVYVAADAPQFVRAVTRAYEEDNAALTRSRLEFSSRNTWEIRGDLLHRIILQTPAS